MSALVIRPFVAGDYDAVRALLQALDERHREAAPWLLEAPAEEPRPPEYIEALLSAGSAALLVADDGDGVIGLVVVLLREPPAFPVFIRQRWGVIDNLVVAPAKRRSGIGTRLLRAGEAWLEAAGARLYDLNVYDFNVESRAFYEAAGYTPLLTRMQKVPREK